MQPHTRGTAGPAATIPLKVYPSLILKSASDCSRDLFAPVLDRDDLTLCIFVDLIDV